MPEPKPKPTPERPRTAPEFIEGPESARRFMAAVKTVLSVPKELVLELEQKHRKPVKK